MMERIKECAACRYVRCEEDNEAVAFYFDYYHPTYEKGREFEKVRNAMLKFKSGDDFVVERFSELMAQIAQAERKHNVDGIAVVPILGSRDRQTDMNAPTSRAAIKIAQALQSPIINDCFEQEKARDKLSLKNAGHAKDKNTRRELVASVLRCDASRIHKRKVILVDDVRTTGATTEIYADLIKRNGGSHVASFYAMRTMLGKRPLNPTLYDELDLTGEALPF